VSPAAAGGASVFAISALFAQLTGRGFGCLGFREHHTAAFVKDLANFGQALPPRRAPEEMGGEAFLEKADMLADHLRGKAERCLGHREGAEIRRLHEGGHASEAIDDSKRLVSNIPKD
jgi:hypothetical protein